ncbi:hypothetical protein DFH09DRAFT_1325016 [Mycena vulgaris]|nr:hypothetical protein DFH09DRAFT_1325016 [Mycena vulgaris]
MTDLIAPDGTILVPRCAIYEKLDSSIADVEASAGASIASSANKTQVLLGRINLLSRSPHSIDGAFAGPGAKTFIPAKLRKVQYSVPVAYPGNVSSSPVHRAHL